MFPVQLPARPNLEQLRKQAKDLLEEIRARRPETVALFERHHPAAKTPESQYALHDAQLVLARRYGFPSWPKLREEVERRSADFSERAARFVCDATEGRSGRARRALEVEPALAQANLWTALVLGDLPVLQRAVERDATCVSRTDGPQPGWTPLLYLSFSCLQMVDTESLGRFAEGARVLLEAGADANASWEHPSWKGAPLKALYGATGVNNNAALARLLIAQGAEVDDGESVYHAAQLDHRESLEVLAEAGVSLGRHPRWKNTPLYFLLGMFSPTEGWAASRRGIRWLLDHGSDSTIRCGDKNDTALHVAVRHGHTVEMIEWLLDAGADPDAADDDGVRPLHLARLSGREDLANLLSERGAGEVSMTPKDLFFEAVFRGDRDRAFQLVDRELLEDSDRLALYRAAERGQIEAVRILLELGFDPAFKGDHPWGATPLHIGAWHGQAGIVDLLLAHGAPLELPANPPEDSPPLAWAAHGSGFCKNVTGDYPSVVRALLQAGAVPFPRYAEMSSEDVAEIFHAALAGKDFPA